MSSFMRTPEQQTYQVDPSSLVASNRSLLIDGAGDDANLSIHLIFAQSVDDRVDLFHCDHVEGELLAINGVLDSSWLLRLLTELLQHKTITLMVRDATENVPSRSESPPKPEAFTATKSALRT